MVLNRKLRKYLCSDFKHDATTYKIQHQKDLSLCILELKTWTLFWPNAIKNIIHKKYFYKCAQQEEGKQLFIF